MDRTDFLFELLDWEYVILGFVDDEVGSRCIEWDTEDEPELVDQVVARMTDGISGRACDRVQVYKIQKIDEIQNTDKGNLKGSDS